MRSTVKLPQQRRGRQPSLRAIATLLLAISIAGCSSVPRTATVVRCPPLAAYPADQQQRAAAELRALPSDSTVAGMIADYGTLRARCRALAPSK